MSDTKSNNDIYINLSYKVKNDGKETKEVIDILNDYPWMVDEVISNGSKIDLNVDKGTIPTESQGGSQESSSHSITQKNNLPFCYVIERKSAANAGVANIVNLLGLSSDVLGQAGNLFSPVIDYASSAWENWNSDKKQDTAKQTTSPQEQESNTSGNQNSSQTPAPASTPASPPASPPAADETPANSESKTPNAFETAGNKIKDLFTKFQNDIGANKLIKTNNLNTQILEPYRYLYITKETGKKYVFPLSNKSSTFATINNSWGAGEGLPDFLNEGIKMVENYALGFSVGLKALQNVVGFLNGEGEDIGFIREAAKGYTYPTDGPQVNVNFTLYNTTKVDAWHQNYKFLFLFVLRNLPLRISISTFEPPLLYDVIVPGVTHLPVCGVSAINVEPMGMIRTLKTKNFLTKITGKDTTDKDITVNVPEAWNVTITFKSLIANSANLMISGLANQIIAESSGEQPTK